MPTTEELHQSLHFAGIASVIAVVATLVVAALLLAWCRAGVAGRFSWRAVCAIAPLASVVILWIAADRIFFGAQ